jgi:formylglycine-generating enzyme required for sulfatase activity
MRIGITALGMLLLGGAAADEKNFADPLPRKAAILKQFVDEFILLTPGQGKYPASFIMGSATEEPAHRVTFEHPFALARYEVTQELYQVVMGNNPSRWKGARNSVEKVSWDEAMDFCAKATRELRQRKLIGADERIRLPSEAEWEYACRAGTTGAYSFGDAVGDLTHYAWYKDNSKGYDPPVGQKRPNPWGFFDMHGYEFEWCLDGWHPNYEGAPADGSAWGDGKERAIRGGAWSASADAARSAARGHAPVEARREEIGFRCVKDRRGGR